MNHVDDTSADVRTMSDPLGEVLDVLSINEYLGWYWGRAEDADKMQWKSTWNKPLIVSEFGGGAVYGRHGDADEIWTEEYQDNLYQHQLAMVERMPNLAGTDAVGADGFSLSDAHASGSAGLSQSQGADFESGSAEAGVLHAAEVLQEAGGGGEVARSSRVQRSRWPFDLAQGSLSRQPAKRRRYANGEHQPWVRSWTSSCQAIWIASSLPSFEAFGIAGEIRQLE